MNIGERKLSIKNILNYVISKWYVLLVSAILFGGVLTGGKYLLDIIEEKKKNEKAPLEEIEEKLEEPQIVDVEYAASISSMINEWETYLLKSELMSIDLYKTKKSTVKYYIDLQSDASVEEQQKIVSNIISAFVTYIQKGACACSIVDTNNVTIDEQYIGELITVEYESVNENNATFTVSVYHTRNTEGLFDMTQIDINSYRNELVNTFGEFELMIVDSYSSIYYDDNVEDKRNEIINNINVYEKKLLTMLEGFSDEQMKYYNYLFDNQKKVENIELSILVFCLGMFVGVAFAIVVIVFLWFSSDKIIDEDDYKNMIEIRLLGTVSTNNNSNNRNKLINKTKKNFIYKSYEELLEQIITNIRISSKKGKYKTIAIVSSLDKIADGVIDDIYKALTDYDYEVIRSTTEDLKQYYLDSQIDACVEIEVLNRSKVLDIYNLKSVVKEMDIPIIGVINVVVE